MKPERRVRKKYASRTYGLSRTSQTLKKRENAASASGFVEIAPQVTLEEKAAEYQRQRAVLEGLFARAQTLVPDAPDSPTRKACRESPIDEIIVEKFRRQGFNL